MYVHMLTFLAPIHIRPIRICMLAAGRIRTCIRVYAYACWHI